MRANIIPEWPDLDIQEISPARLHAQACIACGSAEPPLHQAGKITLPNEVEGVVNEYDVVACSAHRPASP